MIPAYFPVQLLYLLLVCWLPGAVLFRLPWWDRDGRARLSAEERAFWQVILSACVSLTVVLALAALHRYSFERLLAVNAGLCVLGMVAARGRLQPRAGRVRASCFPSC